MDGELAFAVGGVCLFVLFVLYMVVRVRMDSRRELMLLRRIYNDHGVMCMAELDYIECVRTFLGRGQRWYEYHMVFKCQSPICGEYICQFPIKTCNRIPENDSGIYRIAYIPQYMDYCSGKITIVVLREALGDGFRIEKHGEMMAMFADDAEKFFSKGKRKY